jgi:hypothetical protein
MAEPEATVRLDLRRPPNAWGGCKSHHFLDAVATDATAMDTGMHAISASNNVATTQLGLMLTMSLTI